MWSGISATDFVRLILFAGSVSLCVSGLSFQIL